VIAILVLANLADLTTFVWRERQPLPSSEEINPIVRWLRPRIGLPGVAVFKMLSIVPLILVGSPELMLLGTVMLTFGALSNLWWPLPARRRTS
jgi:hypothetical protein